MFRGKIIIALPFLVLGAIGCQTTSDGIVNVDKTRREISLLSSSDERSALTKASKSEDVRKAENLVRQDLKKKRHDVNSLLSLAQLQVAQGKLDEAEKNCKTALRHDLKNQDARKILAQISMRRGNYDLAAVFLNNAGGVNSTDSSVLNMLALIEIERNNNTVAMALFKKAIQLNGNDLAARMNLGVLLLKYRQLGPAAVEFERVLKSMPDHRDAKLHLAIIKATRGQKDEAVAMLRDVLRGDEKNPLALYNLAVIQKQTDDFDQALDNLKIYVKDSRGKEADNTQVFALIDDIQKRMAAKGARVSDEEIQAMAAEARRKPAAPQQSNNYSTKPTAAAKPQTAPKPAPQAAAIDEEMLALPDANSAIDAPDDISSLEATLAK